MSNGNSKTSVFTDAYGLVKNHWGEMLVVFDVAKGFFTKEKPSDDAHGLVKLVHGGKNSIEDEIAYEEIELKLGDDRQLMFDFRHWAKNQFGESVLGRTFYSKFDNDFRGMVLRKREPSRIEIITETTKDVKGKDVVKKSEKIHPVVIEPAVELLRRFIVEIRKGRDGKDGTDEEKIEEGNHSLIAYLEGYNMPSISRLAEMAKTVDARMKLFPGKGKAAFEAIRRNTISESASIASWIDQKHTELEERNNRKGPLAGIRRWYRSLL